MEARTNLSSSDLARLENIEGRLTRLEKSTPVAAGGTPAPVLTAEQENTLAAIAPFMSTEQLAEARAKMLAANAAEA